MLFAFLGYKIQIIWIGAKQILRNKIMEQAYIKKKIKATSFTHLYFFLINIFQSQSSGLLANFTVLVYQFVDDTKEQIQHCKMSAL